jgi:hypothetical protein
MENAISVNNIEELQCTGKKYTRIYYGNEFCSQMMFGIEEIKQVQEFCNTNNKQLTLVTPYMTEGSIEKVGRVFEYLNDNNGTAYEVVINDWGLMLFVNTYFNGKFDLILGCLLNKIKKSPVVMNFIDKLGEEAREVLKTSSCNLVPIWEIIEKYKIKRIEFENVLQENNIVDKFPFEKSLRYPFVFITTARRCITDFVFQDLKYYELAKCKKSCNQTCVSLYNKIMGRDVILKGSTFFYRNNTIPENIKQYSRIVYNRQLTK